MTLNKEILDFFDNRVEYDLPVEELDYLPFTAMYLFVFPFTSHIHRMIVLDSYNYILYMPRDLEPMAKCLIDQSCATIHGTMFRGVTRFEDDYVRLRLIGG